MPGYGSRSSGTGAYVSPSVVRSSGESNVCQLGIQSDASSPCNSSPRCWRAPTQNVAVSRATTPSSSSSATTWKSGVGTVNATPSRRVRSGSIVVAYAETRRTGPNIAVRIVSG